MTTSTLISVVIPVFNERENLADLYQEIRQALKDRPHEIIFVDDGSTDGSVDEITRLAGVCGSVTAVLLARNYGQTAALAAGFSTARGNVIVPIDADGQNDPQDIPRLTDMLSQGFDVVSGWRRVRHDPFWSRRLPSALANRLIARVTGVPLHDFGCTLKAYRREVLENFRLYGEMHRFLPAWCAWQGARITEIEVHHRPRIHGYSKQGISRTFKVLMDLSTTKLIGGYLSKPSYVFGTMAFALYALALASTAVVFYDKLGPDRWPPLRIPLLLLAGFLGTIATLFLMIGFLAELIVHSYYTMTDQKPYRIRKIVSSPP